MVSKSQPAVMSSLHFSTTFSLITNAVNHAEMDSLNLIAINDRNYCIIVENISCFEKPEFDVVFI